MKMQNWEVADKYTILKIKKENGLPVDEQLAEYEKEVTHIDKELLDKLEDINRKMWDKEDVISMLFRSDNRYLAGQVYYELRQLTHQRTAAKNAIAEKYDKYREEKDYREAMPNGAGVE